MTDQSHLSYLIERAVQGATFTRLARAAETAGEELASELLRDPEFRERIKALARAALEKALEDLSQPKKEER